MADRTPPPADRTMLMPRRDIDVELRPGTQLQEYRIEGLVGAGGFSIVYRARDTKLERPVALKEYLPAAFALRGADGSVQPRTPRHADAFHLGLRSYLNEARLLASFDHPALLRVYRFWPENGTAYMVMPLVEGATLKRWLLDLGASPSETWLRAFAVQMTDALQALHAQRIYHRDVAPDNILLQFDRHAGTTFLEQKPRPMLLDFGAARRVIGDATQQLTAILKNGYSPAEQYEGAESKRQGAWTDVYALAAVLYSAIAGRTPPSAIGRILNDTIVPAAQVGAGRYSPAFLAAIDAGLAVRPEHRPQTMAAFRDALDGGPLPPAPPRATRTPGPAARPGPPPLTPMPTPRAAPIPWRWLAAAGAGLAALAAGTVAWWRRR